MLLEKENVRLIMHGIFLSYLLIVFYPISLEFDFFRYFFAVYEVECNMIMGIFERKKEHQNFSLIIKLSNRWRICIPSKSKRHFNGSAFCFPYF